MKTWPMALTTSALAAPGVDQGGAGPGRAARKVRRPDQHVKAQWLQRLAPNGN
jgi:hypothetical protein